VGARLRNAGRSIPGYAPGSRSSEPDLWEVLSYDPLFELRSRAQQAPPVRVVEHDEFDRKVLGLPGVRATPVLASLQIQPEVFDRARTMLRNDAVPYAGAISVATDPLDLNGPVARALAAAILYRLPADAPLRGDNVRRDTLVHALADDLGGEALGLGDWAGRGLLGLARMLGSLEAVVERRGRITDALSPVLVDIVLYQGRGDDVRNFIRTKIVEALEKPPVVVVAHSLGGIACVDLFVLDKGVASRVKALVTVGSQAPFLYEMGALQSLAFGAPIPSEIPNWINIFDRRDFLSFVGQAVFPAREDGSVGIEDVEVENGASVVDAHSAYWSNPLVWEAVVNAFTR
jgi:hypothetical protein